MLGDDYIKCFGGVQHKYSYEKVCLGSLALSIVAEEEVELFCWYSYSRMWGRVPWQGRRGDNEERRRL